jgi:hypothetical protein
MLTLGAMAAALVTCLYFFELPPFKNNKSTTKTTPATVPDSKRASSGFGRRRA